MRDAYLVAVNGLIELHQKVSELNPALNKLYPVAIVENGQFLIYDWIPESGCYQMIKHAPIPMPIPVGIRAAFQLADYDGRIACVVTPEVFDSIDGAVTIFHEFVHCYQYETCEQDLKMQLDIAKKAQEVGDHMWEIEHPFPFQAETFIRSYTQFLDALTEANNIKAVGAREDLKAYLGVHDFEYLVWQEWKEGFARWVENRMQKHLSLPVKKGGRKLPYSRVLFYVGGAAFIDHLSQVDPQIVIDLKKLFEAMYQY